MTQEIRFNLRITIIYDAISKEWVAKSDIGLGVGNTPEQALRDLFGYLSQKKGLLFSLKEVFK